MKTKGLSLAAAAIGAVLAWAGTALADSHPTGEWLTLKFTGDSRTRYGYILNPTPNGAYLFGMANFEVPHKWVDGHYIAKPGTYGGATDGPAELLVGSASQTNWKITGYCIDVNQGIRSNTTHVFDIYSLDQAPIGGHNPPGGMGATKALDLGKLYYAHYNDLSIGTQAQQADKAAAFAACVWEIVNETRKGDGQYDYRLGTGSFQVIPQGTQKSWLAMGNEWLSGLSDVDYYMSGLRALTSKSTQDFAVVVPGLGESLPVPTGDVPVPEPVTLVSAFLAIGTLGMYVRKHTRKPVAQV